LNILAGASALLVQRNGTGTTTILTRIASTLHHAIAHVPWHRSGIFRDRVGTIAFIAVFRAGDREALGRAEIHTGLDGHGLGAGAGARKFTVVDAVSSTTCIRPFLGLGKVSEVSLWLANHIRNSAATGLGNRSFGSSLNGIATGKSVQCATGLLVNRGWDPATCRNVIRSQSEHRAVFDSSAVAGALIDSFL
jgi:hypothetical protein